MEFYVKIWFSRDKSNPGRAYVILYSVRIWRISLPYVSTNIPCYQLRQLGEIQTFILRKADLRVESVLNHEQEKMSLT